MARKKFIKKVLEKKKSIIPEHVISLLCQDTVKIFYIIYGKNRTRFFFQNRFSTDLSLKFHHFRLKTRNAGIELIQKSEHDENI